MIDVSPSENGDLTNYILHAQAHFAQLNDRDEAMSRSLNRDYLDQLLIRADTSRLDARLVAHAVLDQPLPEEEQALLVFKRGCGPGQGKWKQRAFSFHTESSASSSLTESHVDMVLLLRWIPFHHSLH